MNKYKKTFAVLFTLVLLSTSFICVYAEETEYFDNSVLEENIDAAFESAEDLDESEAIEPEAEQTENEEPKFSDISEADWFYKNIIDLAKRGIISGYPDGTFRPEDNITFAEYTKMLVESVKDSWEYTAQPLDYDHWAYIYIYEAVKEKYLPIIDVLTGEYAPDEYISKEYMAMMMVLALDIQSTEKESPFADNNNRYLVDAYTEYLMFGELDENRVRIANADGNATRAEAAAFISRILSYMEDSEEYIASAVIENASTSDLSLEYEFIDFFYYANKQMLNKYSFTTTVPFEIWGEYFTRTQIMYPDVLVGRMYECEYQPSENKYIITVEYDNGYEEMMKSQQEARILAKQTVDNIITPDMTVVDKIIAIHDYIVANCEYDYNNYVEGSFNGNILTAYGVLKNGRAICQGYCAAFNMLCEYAGIKSIAVNGRTSQNELDHLWNAVLVNDEIFYIDTTFDDPIPDQFDSVSREFLYLKEDALSRRGHEWDSSSIKKIYFE